MDGNKYQLRYSGNDLRDDKYWGELLNLSLPPTTDYTKWECYGIKENGVPLVAWCYHSYIGCPSNARNEYEAEMSIAAFNRKWAKKNNIKIMLSLFFNRNGYNRLTALINPNNRQAVKLVKLAGFTLEGIIRKPAGKPDILQFSLLKEDWEKGRFYELYR